MTIASIQVETETNLRAGAHPSATRAPEPSPTERFAQRVGVVFGQGVRSVFPELGLKQTLGFQ